MRACVKCGAPIEPPARGRHAIYCSVACRRASEFELRRLQRRLERLETERDEWDRKASSTRAHGRPYGQTAPMCRAEARELGREIDRLEARLRELLDDQTERNEEQ